MDTPNPFYSAPFVIRITGTEIDREHSDVSSFVFPREETTVFPEVLNLSCQVNPPLCSFPNKDGKEQTQD